LKPVQEVVPAFLIGREQLRCGLCAMVIFRGCFQPWHDSRIFAETFPFMSSANEIIITIDGWSSCGKSTLAKQLARELSYTYIDSGAMYRAITLYFLRNHIDWTKNQQVADALKNITLEFRPNHKNGQTEMYLNGENVEYVIRDLVVAEKVSDVAAIKEVRDFAVAQQQAMGRHKAIVMDGRDIGTVVFPDAALKIFMTADNAIRVERRFKELYEKNPNISIEEVKTNLELRKAADAIELDNSNIGIKEQLELVKTWVAAKLL
jgi:CMP/dCMP kinase